MEIATAFYLQAAFLERSCDGHRTLGLPVAREYRISAHQAARLYTTLYGSWNATIALAYK